MFRFTIRDVLWLTVVVALLVAWVTDHHRMANQNKMKVNKWQVTVFRSANQAKSIYIKPLNSLPSEPQKTSPDENCPATSHLCRPPNRCPR